MTRRPRRILKVLGLATAGLLGIVVLAYTGAALVLQGERLGDLVRGLLPPMKGNIEVARSRCGRCTGARVWRWIS
jgi:hypothetical protein